MNPTQIIIHFRNWRDKFLGELRYQLDRLKGALMLRKEAQHLSQEMEVEIV